MTIMVLGIDLGKNSCSLAGLDENGGVVLRRRMRPDTIASFASKLPACTIAVEACCGAHHMGRLLAAQGHAVRLMSPEYVGPCVVGPYVKARKNDERDAEAIAEAAMRPTMRFVELKSRDQLDMQSLHRVRSRLVGTRTNLMNQLRAILLERGVTIAQARRKLERSVDALIADPEFMPDSRIRRLIVELREEWAALDGRTGALDREFVEHARIDEASRRLAAIPGIGALNATALLAAIGDGAAFARGRDLGAWLGLVPRQHTTGGKPRLPGITKRGDRYLRTLLIHGARAALPSLAGSQTPLGDWLRGLLARRHRNTVVVALANKLARIAWATLRKGVAFEANRPTAASSNWSSASAS